MSVGVYTVGLVGGVYTVGRVGVCQGVHSRECGCLSGCTWWQRRWWGMADKSLQ